MVGNISVVTMLLLINLTPLESLLISPLMLHLWVEHQGQTAYSAVDYCLVLFTVLHD